MKKTSLLLVVFLLLAASQSEARLGGGRSFGSRGSRSVSPRSAPMRSNPQYPHQQPGMPGVAAQRFPSSGFAQGSFLRGLAGGIAGGMLGSLLFRSMGWGGQAGTGAGGSGFGLIEILLVAALAFFAFRWFKNRGTSNIETLTRPAIDTMTEEQVARSLSSADSSVDIAAFKEARVDDFFTLQAALMNRDVESVRPRLTDGLFETIQSDVAVLRKNGKINRLENIAVRESEIVETWSEQETEFATLRLKASLLDYTIDEATGTVVGGSKTAPVAFSECWTFAREGTAARWKLSAIENMEA